MKDNLLVNVCVTMVFFYFCEKIGRILAHELYTCGFHDGLKCAEAQEQRGPELVKDSK